MQTSSRPDQISLTFTARGEAVRSQILTLSQPDFLADLCDQMERSTLTSSRRAPLSSTNLLGSQAVDFHSSPPAITFPDESFGRFRREMQNMYRHQPTPSPLIRTSAGLEDTTCDNSPYYQSVSPVAQLEICNESTIHQHSVALSTESAYTRVARLLNHYGGEPSIPRRHQHMDDIISALPYGTVREHARRQNAVLKRIRLRRLAKKNSLKSRKTLTA